MTSDVYWAIRHHLHWRLYPGKHVGVCACGGTGRIFKSLKGVPRGR